MIHGQPHFWGETSQPTSVRKFLGFPKGSKYLCGLAPSDVGAHSFPDDDITGCVHSMVQIVHGHICAFAQPHGINP